MTLSRPLHHALNLYISPDAYVFEPVASATATTGASLAEKASSGEAHIDERESLVIDRINGGIALNPPNRRTPLMYENMITVYGILGIVPLALTEYIIVISERTRSCRLLGHDVSLATAFRLLPISPNTPRPLPQLERHLLDLVSQGLKSGQLWFSYGWDLTNSLERQWWNEKAKSKGRADERGETNMSEAADDRFFWNKALMRKFLEVGRGVGGAAEDGDLSRFILPVMYGSVVIRQCSISGRAFTFGLISRRSRHRAGTRFFTRGIDHDGNAANFVETEQIILIEQFGPGVADSKTTGAIGLGIGGIAPAVVGSDRFSFVQIRGSAPVFWAQINNLRYTPDLQIMDLPETTSALKSHLTEQIALYGTVYLVNLVNQVKYERPVKEALENALLVVDEPKAKYIYFDFHKECRKMRYDRISGLVERLREGLDDNSYFHQSTRTGIEAYQAGPPRKVQTSVVRTNCMDSLDRTNVVQSALAKYILDKQLVTAGLLNPGDSVNNHSEFMTVFRNIWADHADSVSNAYSGTGALKTDFTRTGKRTLQGSVMDGWNSVVRYVKNNYFDGSRQDALDLLTGAWVMRRGTTTPLTDLRSPWMKLMPYVFSLAISYNILSVLFAWWFDYGLNWSACIFWAIIGVFSFLYIWMNGIHYVDWPRLNPPLEILNYDGPGFKTPPRGRGTGSIGAGVTASSSSSFSSAFFRLPRFLGDGKITGAAAKEALREGVEKVHLAGLLPGGAGDDAGHRRKGRGGRLD